MQYFSLRSNASSSPYGLPSARTAAIVIHAFLINVYKSEKSTERELIKNQNYANST